MYFRSYTHHGEKIKVPSLLGNNVSDIPVLIGDLDLQYKVVDSIYNPNLVSGTVIDQNPAPTDSTGEPVKPGRLIKVRISKSSRLVVAPFVVSKSERFARAMLTSQGLRAHIIYVPSREDQGSVISQSFNGKKITKGMRIPINSVITLKVGKLSDGDLVSIPNLEGLTIKEVKERFKQQNDLQLFYVCSGCETQKDSLAAVVVRQTPIAGDSSKIPAGSTVTVFFSTNNKQTNSQ